MFQNTGHDMFSVITISQGSAATLLRCDGIGSGLLLQIS